MPDKYNVSTSCQIKNYLQKTENCSLSNGFIPEYNKGLIAGDREKAGS